MTDSSDGPGLSVGETLLPVVGAARRARDVVTLACLRWELPGLVGPACLVASELVSNAVQHAGTMVDLRVSVVASLLVIEVGDGSPALPARPAPAPVMTGRDIPGRGLGLQVVAATAQRWGSRPIEGGKVVWAVLRLESGR